MMKKLTTLLIIFALVILTTTKVNAQMMREDNYPTPSISPSDIQSQQQEENQGKQLLDKLNSKSSSCSQVSDSEFEKIGEYLMSQTFGGDTASHIATNNKIKSMMGEFGEVQMHTLWGKRGSNCDDTIRPTKKGGGVPMMGWGYGNNGMMNGNFGAFGMLAILFWLVGFVDLILVGVWLWKQIQKK